MSLNPWEVHCIKDFLFLNCPECAFKTKVGDFFQDHATKNHPSSSAFYERDPLNCINTGKSLSEPLIFASINPQYDNRLFMELP